MMYAYIVSVYIECSPDDSEVSLQLDGRNEDIFGVWDVSTGKQIYGELGARDGDQSLDTAYCPS